MATPLVNKIVLKNTTRMSLNERFTAYRSQAQSFANEYRKKIQTQRTSTSANLRLAQQMANRPSVIAALRLKKRSLQQRLGAGKQQIHSNVKSRLNLSGKRLNSNSIQGRLGTMRGRGPSHRGRGGFKSGTSPLVKARLGLPKQVNFGSGPAQNRFNRQRGGFRGRSNRNQRSQQRNRNRSNQQQQRGAGNRRGGRNNRGGRNVTKQELDNQLDAYMAETKTSLDHQLGQYMQQG